MTETQKVREWRRFMALVVLFILAALFATPVCEPPPQGDLLASNPIP